MIRMVEFSYQVKISGGIHATPAALLAQEAKKYNSYITLAKGNSEAMATNALKIMTLNISQGDTITINIEGCDEEAAARNILEFVQHNL